MQLSTQHIELPDIHSDKRHQIEQINQVLVELASGNYDDTAPISENFDEIDAIASGVNMLSEELRDTVISRNYLDSVLRSIVDMLFIFNKDFTVRQVSAKACELLQQPEDYFIGKPINALFDGRKKAFVQRLKDNSYQEEQVCEVNTSFKIARNENLPVTLSIFALKNNYDLTTGYLMIAEDVKDKLLTSEALKQRNEELKTLIYRASHDLKGPLASMLGLFHALDLEKDKKSANMLQMYLSLVKKSAERLNETLSGLLEVGTVNQPTVTVKSFNMHDTIQEIIGSLSNYPGRRDVAIQVSADRYLPILSSENIIRSVLQNLIENSIKYRQVGSGSNPVICVEVQLLKTRMNILVKDNGQGMDKNVLKNAFTMFYRGHLSSEGSGLGLFIVKSSVEKLGGTLKLKSKVNEGTEVKITLPIAAQS